MRVELTEHPKGNKRFEILLGDVVHVIRLDQGKQLADWIYELHPTCKAENEALKLKAKHVAQSVNRIRSVMRLNREHKDLFGGAVYLVDHTHMWALVRNAEELDALLQECK